MRPTKDETAQLLANAHFRLDGEVSRIFRIRAPDEDRELTPVKLLEVNESTPEVGIRPVGMAADPARGVFYPSIIVEISPRELGYLLGGELRLPPGWELGPEMRRTAAVAEAAG